MAIKILRQTTYILFHFLPVLQEIASKLRWLAIESKHTAHLKWPSIVYVCTFFYLRGPCRAAPWPGGPPRRSRSNAQSVFTAAVKILLTCARYGTPQHRSRKSKLAKAAEAEEDDRLV